MPKPKKKIKLWTERGTSPEEHLNSLRINERKFKERQDRTFGGRLSDPIEDRSADSDRDVMRDQSRADLQRAMRSVQNRGVRRLRRR